MSVLKDGNYLVRQNVFICTGGGGGTKYFGCKVYVNK